MSKLTATHVEELIGQYDFEKIREIMVALDWKWAYLGGEFRVPSIGRMKDCIQELSEILIDGADGPVGTGGFYIWVAYDMLHIDFRLGADCLSMEEILE